MTTVSDQFTLSRASEDDLVKVARLQFECFPPDIREIFMGCKTEDGLPRLVRRYATTMKSDPHDIWIKVVNKETGEFVAASNWKVYPSCAPADAGDVPPEWLDGEAFERAATMLDSINEARRKANTGGYVREYYLPRRGPIVRAVQNIDLHICFTSPDYRRRGAGGMMMRWGADLADQLFLPSWIEASPEGNFLYRKYGFYDVSNAAGGLAGTNMRRDPRTRGDQGSWKP